VISAYCHPSSAKEDCETLAKWLSDHQDHPDPFFIVGDFNHGHHLSLDTWHCILSCAQGDDIVKDERTDLLGPKRLVINRQSHSSDRIYESWAHPTSGVL